MQFLFRLQLNKVFQESKELENTISYACNLAQNVSRKVRDLDDTKARVEQTTKKISDIIDVKVLKKKVFCLVV